MTLLFFLHPEDDGPLGCSVEAEKSPYSPRGSCKCSSEDGSDSYSLTREARLLPMGERVPVTECEERELKEVATCLS